MKKLHTHYDNLKVARNAPVEVIRAAYKSLSQIHHPDRNPGNPEASKIMAIINGSYEVLSDPIKRKEHDQWIAEKEQATVELQPDTKQTFYPASEYPSANANQTSQNKDLVSGYTILKLTWFVFSIMGICFLVAQKDHKKSPLIEPSPAYSSDPSSTKSETDYSSTESILYERPLKAPNGSSWPNKPDYVEGYPKIHTKGFSTVTVDNGINSTDVFVKLVSIDGAESFPVRQFYVPKFSKFTLENLTPGKYDIRYRDLDTGKLAKSEPFNLEENEIENGTEFTNYTMTLYKVENGNMKTYDISESEF